MFFFKFLKYFKPFRWRIFTAVCCLVAVSLLTVIPVFVIKEVVDIAALFKPSTEKDPEPESLPMGAAIALPARADKAEIDNLRHQLWRDIDGLTGGRLEPVRAAAQARVDAVKAWYHKAKIHRPMVIVVFLVVVWIAGNIFKGFAEYMANYQISYSMLLANMQIREKILARVLAQDYLFFSRHSAGYLLSRINSDTNRVADIFQASISSGVQSPLTIVIMSSVLVWLSPRLTAYVSVTLPLIAGLLYYFARVIRQNQRKRQKKNDLLSGTMTESLTNVRLVKAFGTENLESEKFHRRTMAVFKYMMRARLARFGSAPLMEFIGSVAGGAIAILGCHMIISGDITFGTFAAFFYALSRFYRPLKTVSSLVEKYQIGRVSGERMLEMLALEPRLAESANPVPFEKIARGIELRGVGFSYDNAGTPALDGVSFTVSAGQCIAFAGKSGSGKTTLINMIARLIDPGQGQILVDGTDLRELRVADWRARLGMVTQETMLFEDTIANNIAYGAPGKVDMERVRRCAEAAHADEFIDPLPLGYESVVGAGGMSLSGGQRQRLAIARALYRNPEILILDEATSALDSESQAKVQEAFRELMKGRTTFVIAHRISTIRHADCILVFEKGRIVESGTHAELMAKGGAYAGMVTKTGMIDDGSEAAREEAAALRAAEEQAELRQAALELEDA